VTAGVDHGGEITRRVTVTRLVATGIFAFALKKKQDDRELFLYMTRPRPSTQSYAPRRSKPRFAASQS